jgi:pyruvate ferredoxin oxidoreductase alpha subunit
VHPYRSEDADTVVVALGSVLGTVKDVVDQRRAGGERVGVLGLGTFRPFPAAAVRGALASARQVVVVDKALAPGSGGILATDVAMALAGTGDRPAVYTVVGGLGGRPITAASIHAVLDSARAGSLAPLGFLDLDERLVENELGRMAAMRRSGPSAENVLSDLRVGSTGRARGLS